MVENHKPIRVLHLLSYLGHGGIETWLMEMLRKANREEIEIDVCLTSDIVGLYDEEFRRLGGRIHRCCLRKNLFAFAKDLKKILESEKYDIFHSHHFLASGYFLKVASSISGLKLIAHVHPTSDAPSGERKAFPRPLYRWLMKKWIDKYADAVLCPSKGSLEAFWGPDWHNNPRLKLQPNGIDLVPFEREINPAEIRKEFGLPENCRISLTIGRYVPYKNHKIIPDIAASVCSEYQDVYFILNGAGPLEGNIKNKVKELGLEERFRFTSGLPDLMPLWKASDVFLFPSLLEGFGVVVIEAAAAGLPVVATNIPGVIEAATACHSATLMSRDATPQEWSDALKNALKTGKLTGEKLRQFKENFPFTTQKSLEILRQTYKQLVGRD